MIKLFGVMQNTGYSPVKPESNHCIAMFHKNVECCDCKAVCNADAIMIGRPGTGISVDNSKCTGCEKCISACNYGAFKRSGMTEKKWCDSLIESLDAGELVLGCRQVKEKNIRAINCIGSVHAVHIFYWLTKGIKKIVFKFGDCSSCKNTSGLGCLLEQLYSLETFVSSFSRCSIDRYYNETGITVFADGFAIRSISAGLKNRGIGRRDFFKTMGRELLIGVNEVADAFTVKESSAVDFSGKNELSQRVSLFREAFASVKHLVKEGFSFDRRIPLCSINIDKEKCSGCGICIKLCPTGALRLDSDGSLKHVSFYCHGCGVCVKACLKGAISLNDKVLI
ncbi:4Fe-4S dicluster domain-containing protein [Seleniivibrio woodruffii]|uniref:4Fe-4S dicluster domain-containing protein n=1 Tax=Seleniivibrio woodruffii TaxID=1078050 RepID=UPI0024097ABA|nr:4Fe-4S dicluster domain-containing protein [Seleniivibrio woodruffii]